MPYLEEKPGIRIAIDRGGTFCDFWARIPGREDDVVLKLLSVNPTEYPDAPAEGIRQILEIGTGQELPRGNLLDLSAVESIRMGTTVATNALLERKGARVAFLVTKGFRDLLVIGNQARPNLFDLSVKKLDHLYEEVVEIEERITLEGFSENPEPQPINVSADAELIEGLTGEAVRILQKPDLGAVREQLVTLFNKGHRSLAVALMHSYTFPDHELAIGKLAEEVGFTNIALSSQVQPMVKIVPRAQSAAADAYLSPITTDYLNSFRKAFKGELMDEHQHKLLLSQSDGGLVPWMNFTGLRGILSGPAGGVVGFTKTCYDCEEGTPVIGFDMGGTSTDVSRFDGEIEHVFESTTAEITVQSPQLDINTVAAGGGSILTWQNGLFNVGPHSAGAYPGPACYGNGGPLTVTDANFLLGRILPDFFPNGLDLEIVKRKFKEMTEEVNKFKTEKLTPEEVALGFLSVANAAMARPVRTISEGRGFDTSAHVLASFGGAGGQHAVAMARDLGIRRVLIHRLSSILSAYGIALAEVVVENQVPESVIFDESMKKRIETRLSTLVEKGTKELESQGFLPNLVEHTRYLNMRYRGSDTALMIPEPASAITYGDAFVERHRREFGFVQSREIIIDDIRVRSVGKSMQMDFQSPYDQLKQITPVAIDVTKQRVTHKIYLEGSGWVSCPVHQIQTLPQNCRLRGPAMLIDKTQTIVLDESSEATLLKEHVYVEILDTIKKQMSTELIDPVSLSVFSHRFMSIAEQMGHTMQKTSISVNIKERLDYSCAIFSASGGLVANAPHVPGHLGSMSYAVSYQAKLYKKGELKPGDVLVTNHPVAGGTHLPDLTVITPVFNKKDPTQILFYVACRGHHADIGGITAGSMPPHSTELWQEGCAIVSYKMVNEGVFDEAGIIRHLSEFPAQHSGCSGTRTLSDNLADLKAAVASNNHGIALLQAMVNEFSWPVVLFYMEGIQKNAEDAVRSLLRTFSKRFRGHPLTAVDHLDNGTAIALRVTIDETSGSAIFDFTGSGPEAWSNCNAPPSVVYSAIIYALRAMVGTDMPLNQGCLAPITVISPSKSILEPSFKAGTVSGNTETSVRVLDVIFKAFRVLAASQGTCNNVTFGYGGMDANGQVTKGFGYYETIAGGAGAGANWEGQSGVHSHLTNTRITDPETMERRYPVVLREFSIRQGSGGAGKFRGGNGCVRDIEMRMPLQVSVMSERRVIAPYGMNGGGEGARGLNLWIRHHDDGEIRTINLGPRATVDMKAGDRLIINTPGGGGYGVDPTIPRELLDLEEFYVAGEAVVGGRANGSLQQRAAMGISN